VTGADPLFGGSPPDAPDAGTGGSELPRGTGAPYQLLDEIARGGMGIVFKARDPALERPLAVKVLRAELVRNETAVQRFIEEAQVGGQLQHPGIVPVHDLGRLADGRPYFAMKLVKGRTLAELLDDRSNPSTERGRYLRYFLQVCQTVAYAHSHGVIHRDLKPGNVMVGDFGEVLVMDWGLAKVLQASRDQQRPEAQRSQPQRPEGPTEIRTSRFGATGSETLAGSILGTPAFMPPEQAGGEIEKLDARTDVFGLGAILCVILTGHPPYVADAADAVRLMAVRGQLTDALTRLSSCGADGELVDLCRRCLAPDRADRPRDAGELAGAVSAHLAGVEERARKAELERATAAAEVKEQRKRRRVQTALGLTFTALVMLGGAFAWWQDRQEADRRAERERIEREQEAAAARANSDRAARESRTETGVRAALDDARTRTEEAWARAEDPGRMRTAADLAQGAVRRAEGVAATGEPNPGLSAELDRVRAVVTDLDRHVRLFLAAEQILLEHGIGGNFDHKLTAQRLASAFREFGWAADRGPPAAVAEAVVASRVRNQLLGYLGEWQWQEPDNAWVGTVLRFARRKAGGVLSEWQALRDRFDPPRLVAFAEAPRALDLGPEQLCQLGHDLQRTGRPEARLAFLRRCVERYPTHIWLRFDLMETCRAQSPPLAAEALEQAAAMAALRPGSARVQYDLGQCLNRIGARVPAEAAFRRAVVIAPAFHAAHLELGIILRARKDLDGALRHFQAAVLSRSSNPWGHSNMGWVLHEKGDDEGAAACYAEAIRLAPTSAKFRAEYGAILVGKRDPGAAAGQYRTAVRIAPSAAEYRNALAWLLATGPDGVRAGKRAVEEATRACELTGWKDPKYLDTLAAAHAAAGNFDLAIEVQNRALKDPAFPAGQGAGARARLALYEQKKLYLDPALVPRELAPPPRARKE
jgi:serine/threonine-protein kinase